MENTPVPCLDNTNNGKEKGTDTAYTNDMNEYLCTANCSRHCKLSECEKCYSKMHSFNINMGCISTDELLYYLNEQLNICFDKNADKR